MTGILLRNGGWKLAGVGVLILVLTAGFMLTRDRSVEAAAPQKINPDLTGSAVVKELGIQGETDPEAVTCDTDVVVHDGVHYCLDGVTSDPAQRLVIGWQIVGYPATDTRHDYAEAVIALYEALETTDAEDPSIYALQERVKQLKAAVAAETKASG